MQDKFNFSILQCPGDTQITVCKSAAHDPQLVSETILKIRTSWLFCGYTDDAQRYLCVGGGCLDVGPSPQPRRRSCVSQGPWFWSGLGRGRARGRKGRQLYQLFLDSAVNILVFLFCALWVAEFRVLL